MTNEQTAVMLELYLEYVGEINNKLKQIPWILDGNNVEGVEDLCHIVRNVENKISGQIDCLLGQVSFTTGDTP